MAKRTYEQLIADIKRPEAMAVLYAVCDTKLLSLAKDYPEREAATWGFQLEEAKAYLSDQTVSTPFITAALNPGETVEQYATLIVDNNSLWATYAGSIVKLRRQYTFLIDSASTYEELDAIIYNLRSL